MTKPKYPTEAARKAAQAEAARAQMLAQWERQRDGQPLGYFGCHRRVRKVRGPARNHTCECGQQARHWAHVHGTDPADSQNYRPMCQKCHWAYDGVGAKTSAAKDHHAVAVKAWETKRRKRGEDGGAAGDRARDRVPDGADRPR